MSVLPITIFSDFACPASYIMETTVRALGLEDTDIRYRACELPRSADGSGDGFTEIEWKALEELAGEQGIAITRRPAGSMRKAHEAAFFARKAGIEPTFRDALFRAHWTEGQDISRIDVLAALGAVAGLEAEDLRIALDIDQHRDEVIADEELATRLRIPGTPVVYIGIGKDARILLGTRTADELREAIHDAGIHTTD